MPRGHWSRAWLVRHLLPIAQPLAFPPWVGPQLVPLPRAQVGRKDGGEGVHVHMARRDNKAVASEDLRLLRLGEGGEGIDLAEEAREEALVGDQADAHDLVEGVAGDAAAAAPLGTGLGRVRGRAHVVAEDEAEGVRLDEDLIGRGHGRAWEGHGRAWEGMGGHGKGMEGHGRAWKGVEQWRCEEMAHLMEGEEKETLGLEEAHPPLAFGLVDHAKPQSHEAASTR